MTIVFDLEGRRSTHLESGLAVQWVRDDPPMERTRRYKLIVDGIEVQFEASYNYGEDKIQQLYPDADFLEIHRRASELWELHYSASNIRAHYDKEVFVRVWQHLVSQGLGPWRVSTHYTEFTGWDPGGRNQWTCEG